MHVCVTAIFSCNMDVTECSEWTARECVGMCGDGAARQKPQ